ncbi:MAG TPA: CotH kinase family protein, partial [Myxococcota bacterium]|nr:CotH kinase family protein [Myxococcota bacterium]
MNPWRRVYRVRPWPATVLALPLVLLAAWYAWRAFASLDSYRRAADPDHELRLEEYQLALHDALRHDLRRFGMPGPPRRPRVPHLELHLSNANLAALEAGALLPEKRPYVKARLVRGGRREKIKLHLRGTQPWHWLNPQKSLKLKIDDDDAVAGRAFLRGKVLNLVNDPNPVPVADELVFRQARELGLLAPATGFARLKLNGSDLGVFRSSGQVDESVPRAARRFPGSMYSGNLSGKAPADRLWLEPESWKKVSWQPGQEATRADLARLLGALSRGSLAELSDLAAHELDLGRFAALEALEIAFGVDERDARQNHKLYLDPHSGRWEPVAWSLRGFRHRPELELAEHPLGLRLKLVPGYLSLRARALHGLLTGSGRPATVRRQALDLLEELWPELTSDPHWDATKLLPDTSAFLRRMPRFMDEERLTLALEAELATYADRHAFLRERFARLELVHALGQPREAPGGFETDWELWLDGQSGVRLSELTARFAPECAEPAWQVFARGAPLTALGRAAEQPVLAPLVLEPVARLVERPGGELRAVPAPTRYSLRVASRCAPLSVEACGARLDDGSRVRSSPRSPEAPALAAPVQPEPAHVPALAAGESGLHPWSLAPSAPEVVSLGPGEVPVEGQRVYARHQAVVIEPGTTLRLGPGASLIFLGTLEVRGSQESPVQVVASGGEPFGGLALQGPGTAGSRLSHLIVLGGDRPAWRSASYSAALEVQDTERIEIRDCKLRGATREGLHVGSVRGLTVDGLEVEDAA